MTTVQARQLLASNRAVVALARNDLEQFWGSLPKGDPILLRNRLLEFFPDLIGTYGDTAALIAADFYDGVRKAPPSAARFSALLADVVNEEQALAAARWAIGPLFQADPDPVQALRNLGGVTQRLVLQPGRTTIVASARRDTVRTGFARIPVGKTCEFCDMLASRGFAYATEASAGAFNSWHNDCDCLVIPATSADDVPGRPD